MRLNKNPAVAKAGFVHLFTASGALVAVLALQAVYQENAGAAILWLLVALVIDGVDGPMARRFNVKEHMPQIDGETLDLIVDFLTYVLVPVMFMWQFELFPAVLAWPLFGAILMSSLYLFVYSDMKSADNYFNGFPAAWNLVLVVWVILDTPQAFNVLCTGVLCVLTFVPIKSVHPIRVERFNALNVFLVCLWIFLSAVLVSVAGDPQSLLKGLWFLVTSWFIGLSFWRTLVG